MQVGNGLLVVVVDGGSDSGGVVMVAVTSCPFVDVGSLQPNQPGVWQVVVDDSGIVCVCSSVVVVGGSLGFVEVVGSLHPNQPGVSQVVVLVLVVVLVVVLVAVVVVVVVSSRHPHHPGVLQVVVEVLLVEVDEVVEIGSEWLLLKYSQLKQSVQS